MSKKFIRNLSCKRFLKRRLYLMLLQLIIATTILSEKVTQVCATMSPEITVDDNDALSADDTSGVGSGVGVAEKRANWQSLQGSWGKRGYEGIDDNEVGDDGVYVSEQWVPVLATATTSGSGSGSGSGSSINSNNNHDGYGTNYEPNMKYSLIYLTNAANLERLLNQRAADAIGSGINNNNNNNNNNNGGDDYILTSLGLSGPESVEASKRTWKTRALAWGKRRNSPDWNKFRGAWGKREQSWTNLKGMWGKRSPKDWQKLQPGWGKRASMN